jgi:hypothetical protein
METRILEAKKLFLIGGNKQTIINVNGLEIIYAPFDAVNKDAKVLILGITPGTTQMENAFKYYADAKHQGMTDDDAMRVVKSKASFSGPLRKNLVDMLDFIGLANKLGLETSEQLFGSHKHLSHFASFVRYPTYFNGKPYNGTPKPLKNSTTKWFIDHVLTPEIKSLHDLEYIIPVGGVVDEVVKYITQKESTISAKVLSGLPHPSGANAERISYFLQRKLKQDLSSKTSPDSIDKARSELLSMLA